MQPYFHRHRSSKYQSVNTQPTTRIWQLFRVPTWLRGAFVGLVFYLLLIGGIWLAFEQWPPSWPLADAVWIAVLGIGWVPMESIDPLLWKVSRIIPEYPSYIRMHLVPVGIYGIPSLPYVVVGFLIGLNKKDNWMRIGAWLLSAAIIVLVLVQYALFFLVAVFALSA